MHVLLRWLTGADRGNFKQKSNFATSKMGHTLLRYLRLFDIKFVASLTEQMVKIFF